MAHKIDKEYNKPGTIQRMVKKDMMLTFFHFMAKLELKAVGQSI